MVQLKLISEEASPLCKSNQSLFKVKKKDEQLQHILIAVYVAYM